MNESDPRDVLGYLAATLNAYNAGDMLEGYLDPLAEEFNPALEGLGLPTITPFGEGE